MAQYVWYGHGSQWVHPDSGIALRDSCVYIKTPGGAFTTKASIGIDPNLVVDTSGGDRSRGLDALTGKAGYASLNPRQRAEYLSWIASNACLRTDTAFYLIYLTGLEARIFGEMEGSAPAFEEAACVINRMRGLLEHAPAGEIRLHIQRMLQTVTVLWSGSIPPAHSQTLPGSAGKSPSTKRHLDFPLAILETGWRVAARATLGVPLAGRFGKLIAADLLRTQSVPLPPVSEAHFDAEFRPAFTRDYPNGLLLPSLGTPLCLQYQSQLPGLSGSYPIAGTLAPDPDSAGYRDLIDRAGRALRAAALFRSAQAHVPPEATCLFKPIIRWPEKARQMSEQWRDTLAVYGHTLVDLARVADTLSIPTSVIFPAATLIASRLEILFGGHAFVPRLFNQRTHQRLILLCPAPLQTSTSAEWGLFVMGSLLWLCGPPTLEQREALRGCLRAWGPSHGLQCDSRAIPVLVDLLCHKPLAGVYNRRSMREANLSALEIADLAFRILGARGIGPKTLHALTNVFDTLRVPRDTLYRWLNGDRASPSAEVTLDPKRIAVVQADTRRAARLLETIFTDAPAPDPEHVVERAALSQHNAWFAGIRDRLVEKPQWSRSEVEALCEAARVPVEGALEAINDCAWDEIDAPFSEGEDPLILTAEALEHYASETV